MKNKTVFKKFLKELISAVYPNKCICCGEIIDSQKRICDNCDKIIERTDLKNLCTDCGLEKDDCVCKYNIYRFNGLITVFKNNGLARKCYYRYKFSKKETYSAFFAQEMYNAVINCYADVKFNLICSVPTYNKYKYDHSGYLAKRIAKDLNLPFVNDLLCCNKKVKRQHKSTFKERLANVEGKYSYNYRIDNANVLLIDDIKTTGATVDECARVLLYAGAKNVYCVTALGTVNKIKIEI